MYVGNIIGLVTNLCGKDMEKEIGSQPNTIIALLQ